MLDELRVRLEEVAFPARHAMRVFAATAEQMPLVPVPLPDGYSYHVATDREARETAGVRFPERLLISLADSSEFSEVHYLRHGGGPNPLVAWGVRTCGVRRWPLWADGTSLVADTEFSVLLGFETHPAHRGRGLYPALLSLMRSAGHSAESAPPLSVVWCRVHNTASVRGIVKAGFREIAWFGRPFPFAPFAWRPLSDAPTPGALRGAL